MSGLVLLTKAIKIVNRGSQTFGTMQTFGGSDYVIFKCPGCGHRNNQCVHEAESYQPAGQDVIPFKCRMCLSTVEVSKPVKDPVIMTPAEFAQTRRKQTVNRTELGRS